MVSKCVEEYNGKRDAERFMSWGESRICRGESGEEWAEVGGLHAIWSHSKVRSWVAAGAMSESTALP